MVSKPAALPLALLIALLGLATIASAANPKIEEDGSIKDLIEKIHKNGKTECDFTKLLELVEALPRDGEDNDDFYVLFNKKAQDYDAAEGENSVFFAPTNQAIERFMLDVLKATPQQLNDAKGKPADQYYPLLKIVNKVMQYHWVDHTGDRKDSSGSDVSGNVAFTDGFTLNDFRGSDLTTSSSNDDYWPVTATSICDLDEDDDDIPQSTFDIKPNGGKHRITLQGNDYERSQGTVDFRDSKNLYDFIVNDDSSTQKLTMLPIDGVIIPYTHINLKAYTKDCNWPVGKSFSLFERAINMVPDLKDRIDAAWFRGLIVAPSDEAFLKAFQAVGIPSLSRNPEIFFSNPSLVEKVLMEHIIDDVNDGSDNRPGWPTTNCENSPFSLTNKAGNAMTVTFRENCRIKTVEFTNGDGVEGYTKGTSAGLPMENAAEGRLIFADNTLISQTLLNDFRAYEDLSETDLILGTANDLTGNEYDTFMGARPEALLNRIDKREWLSSDRYPGSSILVPSNAAFERLARMIRPDDSDAVQKFSEDTNTVEQILKAFFIDTTISYPEDTYQTNDPDVEVKVTFGTDKDVTSVTLQTSAFYKKRPVAIQMARVEGVFRSLDNRALYFIDSVPMMPETRDSVVPGSSGGDSGSGSDNDDTAQLSSTQRRFQIRLAPQSPTTSSNLATVGSPLYNSFTATTRQAILADSPEGTQVVLESMEVPDGVVTATYLITYPDGTSRSTAATNARNLANADLTSSLGFTATNVQQADITDGDGNGAGASTVSLSLSVLLGLLALVFSI